MNLEDDMYNELMVYSSLYLLVSLSIYWYLSIYLLVSLSTSISIY